FSSNSNTHRKDRLLHMLNLFRRFSTRQKLVMGFFVFIAIVAIPLSSWVDETIMIIGLFWLVAAAVLVTIMFVRRLNAKITRVMRSKTVRTTKNPRSSPRPSAALPLQDRRRNFRLDKSPRNSLLLAKALLQREGAITEAHEILSQVPSASELEKNEVKF